MSGRLKRPLKGRREVEALIGERKNHTFDVWIVILLVERLTKKPHARRVRIEIASCVVIRKTSMI